MSGKYLSHRQTTHFLGPPSTVTITHPHHPLHGQKLELVRVLRGATSKLFVRHPDGRCFRIPRDWTDFEAPQVEQTEAPHAHPLDIKALRSVAKIVGSISSESLVADRGEGSES